MKGHKPINVKAYWVFLGPKFKTIKKYFDSLTKESSFKAKDLEKQLLLKDLKHLDEFVLVFDSFIESDRDRADLKKIADLISITRDQFEKVEVFKKIELGSPDSVKHIELLREVLNFPKVA